MARHLLAWCLVLGLAAATGCGSSQTSTIGGTPSLSTAAKSPAPPLALPAPSTLRLASYTEMSIHRPGNGYDQTNFPLNNVTTSGADAVFTPTWDNGMANPRTGLAYASYVFTADGYDRDFTVRFTWTTAQSADDLFVALANFVTDRWNFYPLTDVNTLTLTSQQFNDAIEPGTGRLAAVVAIKGAQPWQLADIRLGAVTAPDVTGVNPLSGGEGMQVLFNATATGGPITSIDWDFGGAGTPNTSTEMTPQVTLGAPGIYQASVTATNSAGSDTFDFTFTVNPSLAPPDIVAAGPNTGIAGNSEQFSLSYGGGGVPTSWAWDFGGGATPNTSTEEMPTVVLAAAAQYTVNVSATNSAGTDNFQFTLDVTAGNPPDITDVQMSGGAPSGPAGSPQTFMGVIGGGMPTSYDWQFGAGADPPTSTMETPPVTLSNTPGTYPCSLTVANADGSDVFFFDLIVTGGGGVAPDITDVNPQSGSTGQIVTFVPTFTGDQPITWDWDFGGGATPNNPGNVEQPVETLGAIFPGYIVTVTATNATGMDTFQFFLSVTP